MNDEDEVYYCGHCRRQQQPSEGIKCRDCKRTTISWNLRRERESDVLTRWKRMFGN